MSEQKEERIRRQVRDRYASAIVESENKESCCGPRKSCCGGGEEEAVIPDSRVASLAGYSKEELKEVPGDAVNNSFGCGNPLAFAGVQPGQTVLDIGSGAGIDCFLAARKVGPEGRVIGLDMTPEMIAKARANAAKGGYTNVEFRQGVAEEMPVEDGTVDWIVSNCVINLSPNKPRVFSEAYRILKPGGRLSISDIMVEELPWLLRRSTALYTSCIAGAIPEAEYVDGLRKAGFGDVQVTERIVYDRDQILSFIEKSSLLKAALTVTGSSPEKMVDRVVGKIWSAKITARKAEAGR